MSRKRQPELGPLGPDIDLDVEVVLDGRGRRITEARAEQIAAEVLRTVGRPSLTGAGQHSPHLSIRIPAEVHARARAKAEAEGKSISQIAREAIERYVS